MARCLLCALRSASDLRKPGTSSGRNVTSQIARKGDNARRAGFAGGASRGVKGVTGGSATKDAEFLAVQERSES